MNTNSTRNDEVTVQGVKSPVPAVLRGGQAGPRPSRSSDCNDMMVAHLANISDNATSRNPFQRASKLARTPEKVTPSGTTVRSRSSPPRLNEDTTTIAEPDHEREYMSELGENISKLTELMRLPQRSINNNMREVLGNISKLHAYAQEQYNTLKKKQSSVPKVTTEATPKRSRDDTEVRRETPPKRSKTLYGRIEKEEVILINEETKKDSVGDETPREENWVKVKRKRRGSARSRENVKNKGNNKSNRKKNVLPPPRPDAIVIARSGDMSYSDILRAVKKEESLQELGENVSRIKKTTKGEILLELKRASTGSVVKYKEGIGKILGEQAEIKALTHEVALEIRDLDEITTRDDIVEAICSRIPGLENFREGSIRNLRPSYAGTQVAVISLPVLEARKLLEAGKIKIGWVVCRIRERTSLRKCFRCFEYGHMARACKNTEDRSECCLKCGEKGHYWKECRKEPSCIACKKDGGRDIKHPMGSRRCPLFQAASKSARK